MKLQLEYDFDTNIIFLLYNVIIKCRNDREYIYLKIDQVQEGTEIWVSVENQRINKDTR